MFTMKEVLRIMAGGVLLLCISCKNGEIIDPVTGPTSNKQAIVQMVQSDSLGEISLSDEETIDDGGPLTDDDDGLSKTLTSIHPIRWGRQITGVVRNIEVVITGDTIAIATITKTITGNLIISGAYNDTAHVADTIIKKPFTEKVQRKVLFRRVANSTHYERNWIPVAVTLVEGDSKPESDNRFTITSIEYTFPWGRDTITDPLATWLRFRRVHDGIPLLMVGDSAEVRLTISSADPDTEQAVLRYKGINLRSMPALPGLHTRRVRMKLVSSTATGGSFERVYTARFYGALVNRLARGRFHALVDVMSHGTLYDDAKPVSNRYWGLAYFVAWH